MVKADRDCFTASVSEKLQWFKQATWSGELSVAAQESLRALLEGSLEEEINFQLGISRPYERVGPRDQRNGYYTRRLETHRGTIPRLYQRGLHGRRLRVVTTDGAPGLIAALDLVYPLAQRQRCWVHKLRNVSNKLRMRNRDECLAGARAIYQAATRREAIDSPGGSRT